MTPGRFTWDGNGVGAGVAVERGFAVARIEPALGVAEVVWTWACACMVALTIASIAACWVGRKTASCGGSKKYLACTRKSSNRFEIRSWTGGKKYVPSTSTPSAIQPR